jgi:hypothetical protein
VPQHIATYQLLLLMPLYLFFSQFEAVQHLDDSGKLVEDAAP